MADDWQRANGLRIDKLSSDYLSVASATHLYAQDYEAPALYKSGNTYFMFASHESGWCTYPPIPTDVLRTKRKQLPTTTSTAQQQVLPVLGHHGRILPLRALIHLIHRLRRWCQLMAL